MAKTTPANQPAAAKNSETFTTGGAASKASVARQIFNSAAPDTPRKDILARFQSDAGLTKAGAATYYQNMKKDAGMVAQSGNQRPTAKPIATKAIK